MSKEPDKPSESLVQELLAERRQLRVALERARLELAEAQGAASGDQDPRVPQLQSELARVRMQLDETRAEVNLLRTERDELRDGIVRAIADIKAS
jgi:chromosome segregation ATPase